MASHEFRTPLSTVLSSAYLIEKYTTTEDQPKREKHLQRIVSSVNMLTDILNDFLSVGKIEEGKIQVRLTEFNIQELIIAIAGEIKNNLKKQKNPSIIMKVTGCITGCIAAEAYHNEFSFQCQQIFTGNKPHRNKDHQPGSPYHSVGKRLWHRYFQRRPETFNGTLFPGRQCR